MLLTVKHNVMTIVRVHKTKAITHAANAYRASAWLIIMKADDDST